MNYCTYGVRSYYKHIHIQIYKYILYYYNIWTHDNSVYLYNTYSPRVLAKRWLPIRGWKYTHTYIYIYIYMYVDGIRIYMYVLNILYWTDHSRISGDYNNNNNMRLSEMDEGHHSVKYTCVYYSHNIILLLSSRISAVLLWCTPLRERFTGRPRSPPITEAVFSRRHHTSTNSSAFDTRTR